MRADVKAWNGRLCNGSRRLDLRAENEDEAKLLGMLADALFLHPCRGELATWLKEKLATLKEVDCGSEGK